MSNNVISNVFEKFLNGTSLFSVENVTESFLKCSETLNLQLKSPVEWRGSISLQDFLSCLLTLDDIPLTIPASWVSTLDL